MIVAKRQQIETKHLQGAGNTIDEAAAPGYLKTPKGTVALVAMASGLVAEGGSATATRPGVNDLRVEANKPNEEDAQRINDYLTCSQP